MSFNPFDTFGLLGDLTKPPTVNTTYTPGPNFQAGQSATTDWLNQLTADQNDPTGNFGAISPDWNDIWSQTQQQVQDYFNGTATSPGVNDQIKSSFAQRGMSGDPAASYLTAASGANEAQELGNLSAQQNIAKQQFAQTGKQNWMNSIAQLQNQTSNSASGGDWNTVVTPNPLQQIVGAVAPVAAAAVTSGASSAANTANNSWLQSLVQGQNPMSFAPSPGGATGGGPMVTNGGYGF